MMARRTAHRQPRWTPAALVALSGIALAGCAPPPQQGVGFEGQVQAGGGAKQSQATVVYETGTPSGEPLSSEEQALYDSLSPAQKARADQFLRDGSTVASSLIGDN